MTIALPAVLTPVHSRSPGPMHPVGWIGDISDIVDTFVILRITQSHAGMFLPDDGQMNSWPLTEGSHTSAGLLTNR